MVPGIAWISERRPLPALRYLAAAVIALVLLRVAYEPRIVGNDVGTTPFFNWLLYGYGVPAAAFWYAGYLLRRRADDAPARMADSAAILFTVLLAVLQIRHYMNNGDIFRESTALAEVAMQVSVGLAMAIGHGSSLGCCCCWRASCCDRSRHGSLPPQSLRSRSPRYSSSTWQV
jgi:uncharacterized membrane protein